MLKYKYQISNRYRFLNICLKKRIVDLYSTVMPAQLSGPHCRASRISEAFAHAAIRSYGDFLCNFCIYSDDLE